jgi:hypothetical protein
MRSEGSGTEYPTPGQEREALGRLQGRRRPTGESTGRIGGHPGARRSKSSPWPRREGRGTVGSMDGHRRWLVAALAALGLSATAVGLVVPCSDGLVPAGLWRAAEAFASPGGFLWWATLGGAFAGHPSGVAGHLVWVTGTAAFWFLVAAPVVALVARGRRPARR